MSVAIKVHDSAAAGIKADDAADESASDLAAEQIATPSSSTPASGFWPRKLQRSGRVKASANTLTSHSADSEAFLLDESELTGGHLALQSTHLTQLAQNNGNRSRKHPSRS